MITCHKRTMLKYTNTLKLFSPEYALLNWGCVLYAVKYGKPHSDYAVQFWSPYYRMNIDKLGPVQRRMTKMIQGIRNLNYKDRLKHLNLHSLERRKVRGDLIEVFKWIKGFKKGDINKVLIVKEKVRTWTNGYKLDKFTYRKDIGKNFLMFLSNKGIPLALHSWKMVKVYYNYHFLKLWGYQQHYLSIYWMFLMLRSLQKHPPKRMSTAKEPPTHSPYSYIPSLLV